MGASSGNTGQGQRAQRKSAGGFMSTMARAATPWIDPPSPPERVQQPEVQFATNTPPPVRITPEPTPEPTPGSTDIGSMLERGQRNRNDLYTRGMGGLYGPMWQQRRSNHGFSGGWS